MAVAYRMVSLAARFGAVRPLLGVPVDVPGIAGVPVGVPPPVVPPPVGVPVGVPRIPQSMLVACAV